MHSYFAYWHSYGLVGTIINIREPAVGSLQKTIFFYL
nr:MAG TPA: hypothetical protein [Caudoviricetes sp.]